MWNYTIHENEISTVSLSGRERKMIISPDNFGKSTKMCFGVADFPPNKHAPAHVHEEQEEILYVLHGNGEMYFDNKPEKIEKRTCILIPLKIVHSIDNILDEPLKIAYFIFSPS